MTSDFSSSRSSEARAWRRGKLSVVLIVLEAVFIVLFRYFVSYDEVAMPNALIDESMSNSTNVTVESPYIDAELKERKERHLSDFYSMFQDIHVMMFIGFGFLMTFLKRYGFGSVGYNFILAAFVLQWATLTHGFIRELTYDSKAIIRVDVETMINADFAAAAVLISFGAVLGKVSLLQLIIMALFEVTIYQVNEFIVFDKLKITDIGDSMVVHTFGAYFGLAVARVLYKDDIEDEEDKEASIYHSDMFAMIGTLFLWLFWPSFNAGTAVDEGRVRAVINTYYSLTASAILAFAVSSLVHKEKFSMIHIQNSTLAGGVAIGTLADMIIQPWAAILVGGVAGTVSVLGYRYLTPLLHRRLKIHDTCGVNNLHGMPGLISGLGSILAAGLVTKDLYGDGLLKIFSDNSPQTLAGLQAAGLGVSLGMALIGGTITGFILKIPIWDQPRGSDIFSDEGTWVMPTEGFPDELDRPENNNHKNVTVPNGKPHPVSYTNTAAYI